MEETNDSDSSKFEPPVSTKKKFRVQKYRKDWETETLFKSWLLGNFDGTAYCKSCRIDLKPRRSLLMKHAFSNKHKRSMKYFMGSNTNSASNAIENNSAENTQGLGKGSGSLNDSVKLAQLKICAALMQYNVPFKFMDQLLDIISMSFPGSDIAKQLSSKRRKSSILTKDVVSYQMKENMMWKTEYDKVLVKLNEKKKELTTTTQKLIDVQSHNQDLESRFDQLSAERKRLDDALKDAQSNIEKLAAQSVNMEVQQEEETAFKVGVLNKLQTFKEEMSFIETIDEREMDECNFVMRNEISDLDLDLKEHFEQKLSIALRQIREQYKLQMKINRGEIKTLFESKNGLLKTRIKDLEAMLQQERQRYQIDLGKKEEENSLNNQQERSNVTPKEDFIAVEVPTTIPRLTTLRGKNYTVVQVPATIQKHIPLRGNRKRTISLAEQGSDECES